MEISILNTTKLKNVPSGSGLVKRDNLYYVIGDDSPYLFTLDTNFSLISKTLLIDTAPHLNERIIKSEKPDFESLELISKNEMVAFGSGSKSPERDAFIRILLEEDIQIERYQITDFYNHLKTLPLFQDSELNIEVVAFQDEQLFLFNRKKNLILTFNYLNLLAYFKGETDFPVHDITEFSLPKIKGIEAGFSGATTLKNQSKIIFTASVEDTNNAYDDGEILGSFIGMINIKNHKVESVYSYCAIPNTAEKLKVESVTIEEEISLGKTKVLLISDDDLGNSTLIESMLLW
ncbi:DUF6929 family protein [Bizionia myxarmorum]|uniref:DUF4221 domain-containing protein n=1 Tax=Bizionia myxarmorum TaxID=291186 RepID=A0A5D0R5Y2_9FLAO|nr:hypothetical protein [Bizionia myxarmorum]TYB76927.1 hypothetical protein ES674_09495 [Bizionia myxarmorum]